MSIKFCSLSSGSSGNCYYLGNEFHGILIDAGISARATQKFLKEMNISLQTVMGVLVTHNHIDHIRGLEGLAGRHKIPVFTSSNIWKSILPSHTKISRDCIRELPLLQRFHLAGFDIEAFPVCHDAPETIGYHICYGDKKVTVATDLGHICETSAPYIRAAGLLVIESNYDEHMLMNGGYPPYLKSRIRSDHGHLGNHQTSAFIAENLSDNLQYICLAHLSKNNNTPEKALQSLQDTLSANGITLSEKQEIIVLKRNMPSDPIVLTSGAPDSGFRPS